ncbi:MAG TPA: MFS transporter [Symbiobacteriaceae bacterium]|nr:MFS transporter [Symbiobacteriaceae bacterium]
MARDVRAAVRNAVAATVAGTLVQPYVKKMAIEMGASNLQLGYFSSWPNLISIFAVLGTAALVARSREKAYLTGKIVLAGRFAALGAAAVPFLPEPTRILALLFFWVLFSVPIQAAGAPVQSLIADIYGPVDRGWVLSKRQSSATVAGSIVGISCGYILDHFLPSPLGYQIVFCLSFLVALVEVYYLRQMRPANFASAEAQSAPAAAIEAVAAAAGTVTEADVALDPVKPTWKQRMAPYLAVFRHRPFVLFLLCSLPFHFTWQMAWPLFDRYQISYLGANNMWVEVINLANTSGAFFVYPIWQRLAERRGNQLMLGVATLFLGLAPGLTALATTPAGLAVINILLGIGVSGVILLLMKALLDVSAPENREIYIAVHTALVAVSGAIAPLAGAGLMSLVPIRIGLVLCTFFRLSTGCSFFYLSWREKRKRETGRLLPLESDQ